MLKRILEAILAVISGKAVVLVKRDERKADVFVGRGISKQFAVSSMVEAVKILM